MKTNMLHPEFFNSLRTGLDYWRSRTADESEANIISLDKERHNLYHFMTYAEKVPELWRETAMITLQAFYLVERRGYWQEWIPFMERAVAEWVADDLLLKAKILNRLGYLYQVDRRLDEAVAAHELAAALAEKGGHDFVRHQAYFYLCADYSRRREYELAEKYGQRALTGLSRNNKVNKWWAFTLNELGIVACQIGNYTTARQRYENAINLYNQMDEPTNLLRTYNNMISLARELKNPVLALQYHEKAASLMENISGHFDKLGLDLALGGIYFDLERYAEAEAIFRRANSPLLLNAGNVYQRALVLQCLGISLLKQMKLAEAEECLLEGVTLWREVKDEVMLGNTLGTLAELYVHHGEKEKAIAFYREALALFANHPKVAMSQRLTKRYLAFLEELT